MAGATAQCAYTIRSSNVQDPDLLRRLLRARDRIDQAPEQDWSNARLAKVSGVSEAHFARSFKAAFGVPPHRYLLTRRIERATAMLRETDLPITEVALAAGWTSLGTFGRTFRDVTGESPAYLRQRRGWRRAGPERHRRQDQPRSPAPTTAPRPIRPRGGPSIVRDTVRHRPPPKVATPSRNAGTVPLSSGPWMVISEPADAGVTTSPEARA